LLFTGFIHSSKPHDLIFPRERSRNLLPAVEVPMSSGLPIVSKPPSLTATKGLEALRAGVEVTKFSRTGKETVHRLKLSDDDSVLTWSHLSGLGKLKVKSERRALAVSSIGRLAIGRDASTNFSQHLGSLEHLSLSLVMRPSVVVGDHERESLDLCCADEEQFGLLVSALRSLIDARTERLAAAKTPWAGGRVMITAATGPAASKAPADLCTAAAGPSSPLGPVEFAEEMGDVEEKRASDQGGESSADAPGEGLDADAVGPVAGTAAASSLSGIDEIDQTQMNHDEAVAGEAACTCHEGRPPSERRDSGAEKEGTAGSPQEGSAPEGVTSDIYLSLSQSSIGTAAVAAGSGAAAASSAEVVDILFGGEHDASGCEDANEAADILFASVDEGITSSNPFCAVPVVAPVVATPRSSEAAMEAAAALFAGVTDSMHALAVGGHDDASSSNPFATTPGCAAPSADDCSPSNTSNPFSTTASAVGVMVGVATTEGAAHTGDAAHADEAIGRAALLAEQVMREIEDI
jgi:hypothetical protein